MSMPPSQPMGPDPHDRLPESQEPITEAEHERAQREEDRRREQEREREITNRRRNLEQERREKKRRRDRERRCENCGSHTPSGAQYCGDCRSRAYPHKLSPKV